MMSRVKCGVLSVCFLVVGIFAVNLFADDIDNGYAVPRSITNELMYVPVNELIGEEGSVVRLPDSDSEKEAAADLPVYRSEDGEEIEYTDLLYRSHTDEAELVLLDLQDTQLVSCGIIDENCESEG